MGILDTFFKPVKQKVEKKLEAKVAAPAQQQQEDDMRATFMDPASPNYKGPGYDLVRAGDGTPTLQKSADPTRAIQQDDFENGRGQYATQPANTAPDTSGAAIPQNVQDLFNKRITNPVTTQADQAQQTQALAQKLQSTRATFANPAAAFTSPAAQRNLITNARPAANTPYNQFDTAGAQAGADKLRAASAEIQNGSVTAGQPGAEAPDINRDKIDKLLGGLDTYSNDIYALSKDNTGQSVAQAQLEKSQADAKLRAASQLQASQSGALGAARSSRSRNDRALLERAAVGEQAYLGQEAQRQDAQRQTDFEGNQAILRATEADADRRFRLDALSKASDLGLNTAALEADISKANLGSATDWINNQFQQLGVDKQINAQEAQSILGYTRDMAAIQFQYDQLSDQEKQAADAMIMQKYGIDKQTSVALKGIKEQGKFHWDQMLGGILGGVGAGATGGIATLIGGKK